MDLTKYMWNHNNLVIPDICIAVGSFYEQSGELSYNEYSQVSRTVNDSPMCMYCGNIKVIVGNIYMECCDRLALYGRRMLL